MRKSGEGKQYFDQMLEKRLLFLGFCQHPFFGGLECCMLASGECDKCSKKLCHDHKIKMNGGIFCERCATEQAGTPGSTSPH